jgi:hypothetical protein
MPGEIISKQIADLKNGICPFCKHGPLMNKDGKRELVNECGTPSNSLM